MGELSIDNIMTGDDVESLFLSDGETQTPSPTGPVEGETITADEPVDPEDLFAQEGVSGEETQEDGEIPDSSGNDGSSPKTDDFYSSIATACKEEGIFSDLDDESLKNIKDAEGFKAAMIKQVNSMLDERQKRVNEALEYGIEPDEVQKYQKALDWLEGIKEESVKEEGDKGMNLRKNLIFNDFLNRGISKERAQKLTQRAFDLGTDVEDAIDALNSNREFIKTQYDRVIEDAREQVEAEKEQEKKQAEALKRSIIETEEPFAGIKLDKMTRQRVYDNITKPVYKDNEGNVLTALQKAQAEDNVGFITKLGYLYTLTDGFKNLDGLVKPKVRTETKRGISALERALRTPSIGGEPRFTSGVNGTIGEGDNPLPNGLVIDL